MAATTTISAPESGSLTDRLINQIRSSSNDRKPHKKCQLIEDYLSKTIYESDDDFGWVDCDILPYSNSTFVSLALRHLFTNLYEFFRDEKRDFTAKLPQLLTLIFGAMPSPQKESSEIRSILESSDDVMYTLVSPYCFLLYILCHTMLQSLLIPVVSNRYTITVVGAVTIRMSIVDMGWA